MAKHVWSVLSKDAIIDKQTNNVSLIHTLEALNFVRSPDVKLDRGWLMLPLQAVLTSVFVRSQEDEPETDVLQRTTVVAPDGDALGDPLEIEVNLVDEERARTLVKFPGLPFKSSGRLMFYVDMRSGAKEEWRRVAEIPFSMVASDPEDP